LKPNKYQEAIEQITTPPALKEKTRQALLAQSEKHKVIRMRRRRFRALAAILALVIGLSIWMGTEGDLIVTDLTPGEHTEIVIIRDGDLYFSTLTPDELEPPIRLAPAFPLRRNLPLEEYQGVLPANLPPGLSEPAGEITAFFTDPMGEPEAILGRVSYRQDGGGVLTVIFTNDASLLALPVAIGGSQIATVTVGLGFLEAEGIYYGVYEKEGYLFLLTAAGVAQEEFIRLLHGFIF